MAQQPSTQKPLIYSVLLHASLLLVLVLSVDFNSPMPVLDNVNNDSVINAMVLSASPDAPKKRIPLPTPPAPKVEAKPTVAKAEPTPAPEKIKPEPPKPVLTKPIKEAIVIPDKKIKKQNDDAIQQQLLADLKKQTPPKKKVDQQKAIENDFAKEMKDLKAKSLEQQMAQELAQSKQRVQGAQSAKMQGVIDKYRALILQAIAQYWLVPHNADRSLSAQLLIRVAPGGMVLDVQVIKSSGNDALDRSARSAVFKASPLPTPTQSDEFEPFRQFVLTVKPENILAEDKSSIL